MDQKKRISELPEERNTTGLYTLGVNNANESVKVPLGEVLAGATEVAQQAKQTAQAAQTAAGSATTAANAATTAANAATATANAASTAAQEAKTSASTAQTYAEAAVSDADAARRYAAKNGSARFDRIVPMATVASLSTAQDGGEVCYITVSGTFAYRLYNGTQYVYYNNWPTADLYLDSSRRNVLQDKVYILGKKLYVWDTATSALVQAGTDISEVEEAVSEAVEDATTGITFINMNAKFGIASAMTLESALARFSEDWVDEHGYIGTVITFKTADGFESYQFRGGQWSDASSWRKFGGSASVGNCYNVTNDEPKQLGYYTLDEAIAKAYEKGYTSIGIQITFAVGASTWKTYQYVGDSSDEQAVKNPNNWLDLAGMSAGDETLINVDALCGACTSSAFYTLEYAIAAIIAKEAATGITYRKSGLVITYKISDTECETKQFTGTISDFGEASLWQDFGNGGGAVETSDEPQENGTAAFSTGGAARYIPTQLNIDTETAGVVKLSLANEKGEAIGEEKQFAVGTGTGGGSGTIITISPESAPFYTKAGGEVLLRCAIRSVTMQGSNEQLNNIEYVEMYDRDTNQLLQTFRFNQASSADTESYDFIFNLSAYFTQAAARKFKFVAHDDSDNTGSRNVNCTAVDVTIKSEQTLNYTSSTVVNVGGAIKSLPMYRFANNASDNGIYCLTEIYLDGQWRTLGEQTISDTYSHSVSINPMNCCGRVLGHGAYRLRIHGEDRNAGVVGNYLYTTFFCVEASNTQTLIATRYYTDALNATVKQYENVNVEFAVYNPLASSQQTEVLSAYSTEGAKTVKQTTTALRTMTYVYTQRITGVAYDGSVNIAVAVRANGVTSADAQYTVSGTLLAIESVSTQLMLDMDFASRSNSDADKSITSNGYTMTVQGSNYSTNGFIKDSFGTEQYGTEADTGVMALRIAENVTASLNYQPFNVAAIETNGAAIQFRIRTKHCADDNAHLIDCIQNGFGFYVTGKRVVFTFNDEATVAGTINAALKDDSLTDVAIVIEPTSQSPYAGIGVAKMYFDGELIGCCYYEAGSLSRHAKNITFDGTEADLYLYNIRAWETYYSFEQSFNNYLLKLADTDTMIREYDFNSVMSSQAAEGKPATNRPQAAALAAIKIPYFVVCKNADTADTADNYPDYLETLNGDKKTTRIYDIYAYFPDRPWQDFKAIGTTVSNQGTTSSWRPIKNIKMKLKNATIVLLHDASEFSGADLLKYNECAQNAANHKVQITDTSLPSNIVTVKVDYSESGGANNGASCQLFNELQRALGANYMTPAQVYYTGTYTLNTSIDSIPCAFFRTDAYSADATSPTNAYFHAKGNWNQDKGDAAVFGFEKVDGYNKNCLNYGDFYELIAARNQTLDAFLASQNQSDWNNLYMDDAKTQAATVIVLSEFCGPNHRIFRKQEGGTWNETTGTMTFTNGQWRITGDYVNPVENYELKAYDGMDWFQGVDTEDDMLTLDAKGKPCWLAAFESRYPDNDALNEAYEDGRKLPYRLFKWLQWCNQCNQHKTAADGNITIDGTTVSGTPENRLKKFKRELHKIANVHSCVCYHVFTDYILAVDQRSKNMMVGFYLDTDLQVRMYLNHLYDGDTILGSDNDCGLTIPAELDPNNDVRGYYQGYDSVLFTQLAASDYLWLKDYTSDSDISDATKTTTVAKIAAAMRSQRLADGTQPFSPLGIQRYWIEQRLQKWPKLVSSYDGVRKYIEHSTQDDNYFYALHGLSIQRLEDLVKTRFLFRDGFYQCGDMYSSALQMRCVGNNMSVTIKAAKDGFFGIGVDQSNSTTESCYLRAGETATLHSNASSLGGGYMLYIYGANKIEELDIRNACPKQAGWNISELTLLKKFVIGGAGYSPVDIADILQTLNLGQLPFLEELDVRNFPLTSINAEFCPRLQKVLATGSRLTQIALAETSPISELSLPNTMQNLSFVNLPNLTYPNGNLTLGSCANVKRLQIVGCAGIDTMSLMRKVIQTDAATLQDIKVAAVDVTADKSLLVALKNAGTVGVGSDEAHKCEGITGRWILTELLPDAEFNALNSYFSELSLHNSQFTIVEFDDTKSDPQNITNLENNTTGDSYTPTGHIVRIREKMIPVYGKVENGVFVAHRLNEANYRKLYNGDDFDFSDSAGNSNDTFMRVPHCWYKGINDFKNQKKYICWSSSDTEPISTASRSERKTLSDILYQPNKSVYTDSVEVNTSTINSQDVLIDTPNFNVYRINVEGMKQVRWPGLNNAAVGAVFVNADGVIIGKFNMTVSHQFFDFIAGEDYVFCNVPEGAVAMYFTSMSSCNSQYALAVNSDSIEAIEPDWVENEQNLIGIYHASIDALTRIRSLSNVNVRVGTGTATTSSEWTYDSENRPRTTPVGTMNYTCKDFQNLAMRRGAGYQLIDYEQSKFCAILWYSLNGTRNAQTVCGQGRGSGGQTGYTDTIGNADSYNGQVSGNKCLGIESFFACTYEWMDNVAVNVKSWASFFANKCVALSGVDTVDYTFRIFDPVSKTERAVKTNSGLDGCIVRVRHGRFCDVVVSKTYADTNYLTYYTDWANVNGSTGRVVGRSHYSAVAYGGLVYASTFHASSNSGTHYGSRLAFRGAISVEGE